MPIEAWELLCADPDVSWDNAFLWRGPRVP